ncbi:hypothetical protein M885DRAFT_510320 [Pelagophyceae sp. CCMP2097]|nr:hypothetical protein M885DRAFT_510320 [Pelagophyceae sp. CCMP2097]
MSSSLLEKARGLLEELDCLEQFAVDALSSKASGSRAVMEKEHSVALAMVAVGSAAQSLQSLYGDDSGLMQKEVACMRGSDAFPNFYGALKSTREYYAKHDINAALARSGAVEAVAEEAVLKAAAFTGEEMWGKYADFSSLHREFINLKGAPGGAALEYAAYLRMMANRKFSTHLVAGAADGQLGAFGHHSSKDQSSYLKYVEHAEAYVVDFGHRALPLMNFGAGVEAETVKFEAEWAVHASASAEGEIIDLAQFQSADDLAALGLDRLKRGLVALGLKCGGDVQARAVRLFSVKGIKPEDVDSALKQKVKAPRKRKADDDAPSSNGALADASNGAATAPSSRRYRIARCERRIEAALAQLDSVLDASVRRAERKLTRTKDEIDAEVHDEEHGPAVRVEEDEPREDPDEDSPIYNPKGLPLGWDGRPIPYWLYKLHGLDVCYSCEICGGESYYGRRAFDQHFNEWRHSHGMRCLRIPNSGHFHGVCKMDDAVALWEHLQEKQDVEKFKAERDEEYEDSDGNVLNRATYEDLARQGLL